MSLITEDFWDNLLTNIEEQRVIPIVGPELLTVQDEGVEKPLNRYVAERVAQERGIDLEDLSELAPLNDVVGRWLREKKHTRNVIYKNIKAVSTDAALTIPDSLLKLAQIRHFKLFVTTTFDSLMERALNQVRAPQKAQVLAYTPNGSQDLPTKPQQLNSPVVYHLLGRASPLALPDELVVTEEDLLEFVYSLFEGKYRPEILFDALKGNSLLIIGSSLSDWLARFFIRVASGKRLSAISEQVFLADRLAGSDRNLMVFLERFTNDSSWVFDKGAAEFVDELWQRYSKVHPDNKEELPVAVREGETSSGAAPTIFLSYTTQDAKVAAAIRDVLEEMGWDVWRDKDNLRQGDNWNDTIQNAIKRCTRFLPILSYATEAQEVAYFRKEWRLAAQAAEERDDSVPYLLPIGLSRDLKPQKVMAPQRFKDAQWGFWTEGETNQKFKDDLRQNLRDLNKNRRGRV